MGYRKFYEAGPRAWSQWEDMGKITHFACCDCGLVHSIQFRVDEKSRLVMRVRRHKAHTAARRKQMRHVCTPRS